MRAEGAQQYGAGTRHAGQQTFAMTDTLSHENLPSPEKTNGQRVWRMLDGSTARLINDGPDQLHT
jgi:hypothetical protein